MAITDLEDWLYTAPSREHSGVYDDLKLEPVQKVITHWNYQLRPITVAGTKGKGSTVRFIESGLIAASKTCLSFTSPHVLHINERWRLNGQSLDDATLLNAAEAVASAEIESDVALTYYERCFCIAAYLSSTLEVDEFLSEVGLGGRLDCANVLDAKLAIVTAISYDHCAVLGNTLKEIASEKLAIARSDAPLLIGPQSPEAEEAMCFVLPENSDLQWIQKQLRFELKLPGDHQQGNASTALAALKILAADTPEHVFIDAFAQTELDARCQVIEFEDRRILIDASHNGESIKACMAVAEQELRDDWSIIIGSMIDKQLDDICAALPKERQILRCGFDWPRACGDEDWPAKARQWDYFTDFHGALERIPSDQDICICGSFYLAGEVLNAINDNTFPG